MVQWAGLKDGDRVLEPSAGHGAISRFFSPNTDNTIIEPSSRLAPQAQMNTDNAKLINGYFEDLHIGNKYDAVTMNPPFGTGGKTAVEHVAKAFNICVTADALSLLSHAAQWQISVSIHGMKATMQKTHTWLAKCSCQA